MPGFVGKLAECWVDKNGNCQIDKQKLAKMYICSFKSSLNGDKDS